jgi:two-component system response regulator
MEPLNVQKGFGAEVRRRRRLMGLSQERLAELASLHRTYVSAVESGRRNPSLSSLQRLAKALGASLGSVFVSVEKNAQVAESRGNGQNPRAGEILLVEDDPVEVRLALAAFKKARLANPVRVVRDGAEAIEYLFENGPADRRSRGRLPQLVLLDLRLPRIQGLEVLRRLKATAQTRSIPVIALAPAGHNGDIQEALRLRADAYIIKPVGFDNLIKTTPKLSLRWALLQPSA